MTVYLVDMENIPHAWGKLLESCKEGDRFVLFYTDQISQVPIALMEKVTQAPARMDYIKCHSGPNSLDFQLVTEMGYRIARDPEAEYVIVSHDHGFDAVVDYWGERGVRTKRVFPPITGQGGAFPEHSPSGHEDTMGIDFSKPQCVRDFLCWKLSNKVPKGEISFVAGIMMEAMGQGSNYSGDRRLSCRFTYLDRSLRKQYGDSRGAKIRDQIKTVSREVFVLDLPEGGAALLAEPEEEAASAAAETPMALEPAAEAEPAVELKPEEEPEPTEEPESAAEPEPTEEVEPAEAPEPRAEPETAEKDELPAEPEPPEEPEPPAEAPESPDLGPLLDRLSALGLTRERSGGVAAILSEILAGGAAHPQAAAYRRILSAYGRREGTDLYRAVRETVSQILDERSGTP